MLLAAVLILLIALLFVGIIVDGICASAYYYRFKYEAISRRQHLACRLYDAGKMERARKMISDH